MSAIAPAPSARPATWTLVQRSPTKNKASNTVTPGYSDTNTATTESMPSRTATRNNTAARTSSAPTKNVSRRAPLGGTSRRSTTKAALTEYEHRACARGEQRPPTGIGACSIEADGKTAEADAGRHAIDDSGLMQPTLDARHWPSPTRDHRHRPPAGALSSAMSNVHGRTDRSPTQRPEKARRCFALGVMRRLVDGSPTQGTHETGHTNHNIRSMSRVILVDWGQRDQHHGDQRQHNSHNTGRCKGIARANADDCGDCCCSSGRDGRHDSHSAHRKAAIKKSSADSPAHPSCSPPEQILGTGMSAKDGRQRNHCQEPDEMGANDHVQGRCLSTHKPRQEIGSAPTRRSDERQHDGHGKGG